jgi:phosphoglycolate phosphatase-like HAD superfamily hydrolase
VTDKQHKKQGVLLDLDGTLVDSVYQHVCVWHDVLESHGHRVPHWRIHRAIGMGASRLVPWLIGKSEAQAEAMADEHDRRFIELAPKLQPTTGALELLDDLEQRRVPHHVVTSAKPEAQRALFDVLGRSLATTDASEVSDTKPTADPVFAGARALGISVERLSFVGDSLWDGEAARRAGVPFIAVRCGGFSDELLRQSSALWVEDSPRELIGRL